MRNINDITKETSPADTYDALVSIVGKSSKRVITWLDFSWDGVVFWQAVTLRSLPARPDMIKDTQSNAKKEYGVGDPLTQAISLSREGKVLVVDASGYTDAAIAWGTKLSSLWAIGAAWIITDGSLRDLDEFERFSSTYGMITHCSGWTPQSGTGSLLYPTDINVAVSIKWTLVRPWDYIFGDNTWVLVIPEEGIEEVLELWVLHTKINDYVTAQLEETKWLLWKDILPKSPDFIKKFLADSQLSEYQTELFKKYMGGDIA